MILSKAYTLLDRRHFPITSFCSTLVQATFVKEQGILLCLFGSILNYLIGLIIFDFNNKNAIFPLLLCILWHWCADLKSCFKLDLYIVLQLDPYNLVLVACHTICTTFDASSFLFCS
jgi:hypothetical protein